MKDVAHRTMILWIAVLTVGGALLRARAINAQPLWIDESMTVMLARIPLIQLMTQPVDPTPGAFYALQQLFVGNPHSAGDARMLALAFGIASIPAAGWLGRGTGSQTTAIYMAALAAVFPVLVDQSIEARAYPMLLFGVILASAGILEILGAARSGRGSGRGFSGFVVGAVLVGNAHASGMLLAAILALFLLLSVPPRWRFHAILAGGVAGIFILPAFLQVLAFSRTTPTFWVPQPDAVTLFRSWLFALTAPGPAPAALKEMTQLATSFAILFAAIATIVAGRRSIGAIEKSEPDATRLALLLVCIPLWMLLPGIVAQPVFLPRTIQPAAIGGLLLLSMALARLGFRWLAAAWIGGFLCFAITLGPSRKKEDWRTAARVVSGEAPIRTCPDYLAVPLEFALREQGLRYGPLEGVTGPRLWPSASRPYFDKVGLVRWTNRIARDPAQSGFWVGIQCPSQKPPLGFVRLKRRGTPEILVGRFGP